MQTGFSDLIQNLKENPVLTEKDIRLLEELSVDLCIDYQIEQSAFMSYISKPGSGYDSLYYQNTIQSQAWSSLVDRQNEARSSARESSKALYKDYNSLPYKDISEFKIKQRPLVQKPADLPIEAYSIEATANAELLSKFTIFMHALQSLPQEGSLVDSSEVSLSASPDFSTFPPLTRRDSDATTDHDVAEYEVSGERIIAPISIKGSGFNAFNYNSYLGIKLWLEYLGDVDELTLIKMDTAHIHSELIYDLLTKSAKVTTREDLHVLIGNFFQLAEEFTGGDISVVFNSEEQRYARSDLYSQSYSHCEVKCHEYSEEWDESYYDLVIGVCHQWYFGGRYFSPQDNLDFLRSKGLNVKNYYTDKYFSILSKNKVVTNFIPVKSRNELYVKGFNELRDEVIIPAVKKVLESLVNIATGLPFYNYTSAESILTEMGGIALVLQGLDIPSIRDKLVTQYLRNGDIEKIKSHLSKRFKELFDNSYQEKDCKYEPDSVKFIQSLRTLVSYQKKKHERHSTQSTVVNCKSSLFTQSKNEERIKADFAKSELIRIITKDVNEASHEAKRTLLKLDEIDPKFRAIIEQFIKSSFSSEVRPTKTDDADSSGNDTTNFKTNVDQKNHEAKETLSFLISSILSPAPLSYPQGDIRHSHSIPSLESMQSSRFI